MILPLQYPALGFTQFVPTQLTSTVSSTSKDPIAYISEFTDLVTGLFQTHILNLDSSFWSSYYGLFYTPFLLYVILLGLNYATGSYNGEKVRKELKRGGQILGLMCIGFTLIPFCEYIGDEMSSLLTKQVTKFGITVNQSINDNAGSRFDFNADTEENRVLKEHISKSDMNSYNIIYSLNNEVENGYKVLSQSDALVIETIKHESGVDPNNTSSAKDLVAQPSVDKLSFWEFNFIDWITYLLLLIGNCLKCLMLLFRLFLLALLRFSFPIALAVSLIPSQQKVLSVWFESYITIIMLGITITLISAIASFTSTAAVSSDLYSASFMAALMAFLTGIFYLLSPAITVMLFGGSGTVSQMPQQIVTAGAGIIGLASFFPKKVEPKNNSDEGSTPTPAPPTPAS